MSEFPLAKLSWCPHGIGICNPQERISFAKHPALNPEHEAPYLPDIATEHPAFSCIYIPIENMLIRSFHFPLKHIRHLDAAMLSQELADTAGIEPDDWWLSWQASKTEQGISGLAFALPQTTKQAMQEEEVWQQTPLVLIDGWERLNHWLHLTDENKTASLVVFDTDAEGIFFGFYQHGAWQGMRRLNGDMHNDIATQAISQQILWSLQTMGASLENTATAGRLTPELAAHLSRCLNTQAVTIEHNPKARHQFNLELPCPSNNPTPPLNIRHGQWSTQHKSHISREWYRPAMFAASICLLWLGLTVANNYQLEAELATMHEDITEAFHMGLPQQPVIIDALAQLRQAAHGGNRSNTPKITQQLQYINETFTKHTWQMQELRLGKAGITITGKVSNLDTLNTIRQSLEKKVGTHVQIIDTDLNGNEVTFRIRWQ